MQLFQSIVRKLFWVNYLSIFSLKAVQRCKLQGYMDASFFKKKTVDFNVRKFYLKENN